MTDEQIVDEMRMETTLNKARRAFSYARAQIEQAGQQRRPPTSIEIHRMEFEAVRKIAAELGVRCSPVKVDFNPLTITRGADVEIGNVYACNRPPAFKDFRIVVGKTATDGSRRVPWNNVIMIHVNATGDVVGCSRQPTEYVKNKWDLLGRVEEMPVMKIKWIRSKV